MKKRDQVTLPRFYGVRGVNPNGLGLRLVMSAPAPAFRNIYTFVPSKTNTSFTFSSLTCSQLYAFTDISFFNKIKYQFLLALCAQVGSWGGRLSRAERVSPPACGSRCRGPLAAAQLARAASPAPAPGTGRAPQQQPQSSRGRGGCRCVGCADCAARRPPRRRVSEARRASLSATF